LSAILKKREGQFVYQTGLSFFTRYFGHFARKNAVVFSFVCIKKATFVMPQVINM